MTTFSITDTELDRLETLLDDPVLEDAMRLDEIQGYLCAALAGPQPVPPEERLAEMLGEPDDPAASQVEEVRPLITKVAQAVEAQLAGAGDDDQGIVLWLYPAAPGADAPMDYGPWCMAYLHGVDAALEDWFDRLNEEEAAFLDERLYPMMVLTGEAEAAAREHGDPWPDGEELAELLAECEDSLPEAVEEIHRFWVAKRSARTVRRDAPKVGRNDPCHCGSGKKYKQCCGAEAAA